MYIKIAKTRDVKSPVRANPGDALDFFVPNDFKSVVIHPGTNVVIPAGIKVEVPFGYGLVFLNKSGIASKQNLIIGACLVDHGYNGEVHVDIHNIDEIREFFILPGMKIAQAVLVPLLTPSIIEVPEDELYRDIATISSRGTGGFGSTGT